MIVRVLDIAAISFVGAHVEDFPTKFLFEHQAGFDFGDNHNEIILFQDTSLRKRSLGCLAHMLNDQKVWVIKRATQRKPKYVVDKPLWIWAIVENLVVTLGQAWSILDGSKPSVTKRIGIGSGFLVRHTGSTDHPIANHGEVLSHWTDDEEEYLSRPSLCETTSSWKLSIGTAGQMTESFVCPANSTRFY
jgi:hypothetical protein